ncbi:MAG: diphosphomevalonate decarboxylase [Nitrososphaerota archaeon]
MRARALAHPMQALVKYHGLRDWELRIPYHDSISVNVQAFHTVTEVEFGDFPQDTAIVNGAPATLREMERIKKVVDRVRNLAGIEDRARIVSVNSTPAGGVKGLGFSSSAGAALATAAFKASGLDKTLGWDVKLLSRTARLLAGSACRSVVGYFARWYAGTSDEDSYATSFSDGGRLSLGMVIVPLPLRLSTEDAHREAELSPFFRERCITAQRRCDEVQEAILEGDLERMGRLVEQDSLELHAVTMTGPSGIILLSPESLKVLRAVEELRREGVECYYSMQTGPTVFINAYMENTPYISSQLEEKGFKTFVSGVGGPARIF